MKKYYSLMIVVLAFVTGTTGCIVQATKYGIPDHEYVDENHEIPDETDEIQTDTDATDIDITDSSFDSDTDFDTDTDAVTVTKCPSSDMLCHEHDGLYWSDLFTFIKWETSGNFCGQFAGRLPTISELRSLVQNCPDTGTGGSCGITAQCAHSDPCWNTECTGCRSNIFSYEGEYSVFGDTEYLWSSSFEVDRWNAFMVWGVDFKLAEIKSYASTNTLSLRCVTSNKKK